MRGRSPRRVVVATFLVTALALSAMAACQSPTQIVLHLRTNVQCEKEAPAPVIAIGRIDKPDDEAPYASVHVDCTLGGELGTVVVTPTSKEERDARVGIRVAMRYANDRDPGRGTGDCTKESAGLCIVSRLLRDFQPHETIDIDVNLNFVCKGVYCSALETCNGAGKCVDARCEGAACDALDPNGNPDASGVDGARDGSVSTDGSSPDGNVTDGRTTPDGSDFSCSRCDSLRENCCANVAQRTIACIPKPGLCEESETLYECWTDERCQGGCCGKILSDHIPGRFACHPPGECTVKACTQNADCGSMCLQFPSYATKTCP